MFRITALSVLIFVCSIIIGCNSTEVSGGDDTSCTVEELRCKDASTVEVCGESGWIFYRDCSLDGLACSEGECLAVEDGDAEAVEEAEYEQEISEQDGDASEQDEELVEQEAEAEPNPCHSDEILWVDIPGGSFMMGCTEGDTECESPNSSQMPRHEVAIQPFKMMASKVTMRQFNNTLGHYPNSGEELIEYAGNEFIPAISTIEEDASLFCQNIGGRLPSEAEWEYAIRGGENAIYLCGNDISCLDEYAWHEENTPNLEDEDGHLIYASVCLKKPNYFGLYDVVGNGYEWVSDNYHDNYEGAPTDGSAWMNEDGDAYEPVARGYDAHNGPTTETGCKNSFRYPYITDSYFKSLVGFRCVKN